jgi:hydrogenase maturation protease
VSTVVIGLGNRDRGDDAVGLAVADRLATHVVPADVLAWERPELDLLDVLPRYDRVVVVDAVRSGAAPGTVHEDPTVLKDPTGLGSHGFGLAAVLELADALGRTAPRVHLLLVEIGPVEHGRALTPAVRAAADDVLDRLLHALMDGDADVLR